MHKVNRELVSVAIAAAVLVGCSSGAATRSNVAGGSGDQVRRLSGSSGPSCDPNYAGCVPLVSFDLDCSEVSGPVQVIGRDPHGFDRDGDGRGCESN